MQITLMKTLGALCYWAPSKPYISLLPWSHGHLVGL
ncbi:hypothetical protein SLEP1_g13617 [Rubroshorea leprosula]|uniref:Uncharacterized protein n=1 Tax=Rubroshorea leprosula TaxID=152421 RepID=A0AAV5IRY2_9ROSI|nr:hypothetical protein SLEP1_g13617 [Rubroshorea leprosula]